MTPIIHFQYINTADIFTNDSWVQNEYLWLLWYCIPTGPTHHVRPLNTSNIWEFGCKVSYVLRTCFSYLAPAYRYITHLEYLWIYFKLILEEYKIWKNYVQNEKQQNHLFQDYLTLRQMNHLNSNDLDMCRKLSTETSESISNLEHYWRTGPINQQGLEFQDTIIDVKLSKSHIIVLLHNRNPFRDVKYVK